MNKVYVFVHTQVFDGEVLDTYVATFSSREKALKAFSEWKEDEKECVEEQGWTIEDDDEDYFQASLDGYYAENHAEGSVIESEVE